MPKDAQSFEITAMRKITHARVLEHTIYTHMPMNYFPPIGVCKANSLSVNCGTPTRRKFPFMGQLIKKPAVKHKRAAKTQSKHDCPKQMGNIDINS